MRPLADGTCELVLRAVGEPFEGMAYTSARITTKRHPVAGAIEPPRDPATGAYVDGGAVRVEARAWLPDGTVTGTWPAFWMLPTAPVCSRALCLHVAYCFLGSPQQQQHRGGHAGVRHLAL